MAEEQTFNAGEETQVKKRVRKEELEARQAEDDLRAVMAMVQGRRFIWRWLGITGIHRTSFSTNALTMAKDEGRRNVGLQLEAELMEADVRGYLTMQNEAINKEKADG